MSFTNVFFIFRIKSAFFNVFHFFHNVYYIYAQSSEILHAVVLYSHYGLETKSSLALSYKVDDDHTF